MAKFSCNFMHIVQCMNELCSGACGIQFNIKCLMKIRIKIQIRADKLALDWLKMGICCQCCITTTILENLHFNGVK